jgi:Zn finger protein HypA/HybF involved in hydrogenase expression
MSEYRTLMGNEFEFDEDFPITFCPVCGSDDITTSGFWDRLLGSVKNPIQRVRLDCRNCNWNINLFILDKGETDFDVRKDQVDCEECKERFEKIQGVNPEELQKEEADGCE